MEEKYSNRMTSVLDQRKRIHRPCSFEYVPVPNYNKSIIFSTLPGFDNEHFNMQYWRILDMPENEIFDINYVTNIPVILLCYEWTDSWQHFMQDLVPIIVSAKDFLSRNIFYPIIVKAGPYVQLIKELLYVENPILQIAHKNEYINRVSRIVYTFEPESSTEPNTVSNSRKPEYYKEANKIIRRAIREKFPSVEHVQSEFYILYLSREGCSSRRVRQDAEIRCLSSAIKVFNLNENKLDIWDTFKLFYNAGAIIAPHGGAIYNILACRPNIPIIEFFSGTNYINIEHIVSGVPFQYYPVICDSLLSHDQKEYDVDIEYVKKIINNITVKNISSISVESYPKITFICCPKPFIDEFSVIQTNAILSWKRLKSCSRIIVASADKGVDDFCKNHGLIHAPQISMNKSGTPLMDSIFQIGYAETQKFESESAVVCYVNSDIIFLDDFDIVMSKLFSGEFNSVLKDDFLLIGRHYKWPDNAHKLINFEDPLWQKELLNSVLTIGKPAPSCAIDFFIHTPKTYSHLLPFAIGKYHWDRWLVYEAIRLGRTTIDLSNTLFVVHQNAPWFQNGKPTDTVVESEEVINNKYVLTDCKITGKDIHDCRYVAYVRDDKLIMEMS